MGYWKRITTVISLGTALITTQAFALEVGQTQGQVSADVTMASTYLWRGVALSADAALQGNFHFTDVNGIHGTLFTSNVFGGSELDVEAGFRGTADLFKYDVGGRLYYLPQYDASNFVELYIALVNNNFGGKISISPDSGIYIEGSVKLPMDTWDLKIHVGHYSVDENDGGQTIPLEDYLDFSFSGSRTIEGFEVGLTLSGTTLDDNEVKNGIPGSTDNFRTVLSLTKYFRP